MNKELRTIKIYKAKEGPPVEGKHPFPELEQLFAEPEMQPVRAKDFLAMKYEFEEFQKFMAGKPLADFALISRIEHRKKLLDKVRQFDLGEEKLQDFIEEALQARAEHHKYLQQVDD